MKITFFGRQFFINKVILIMIIALLVIGSGVLGYFLKQVYHPLSVPEISDNSEPITQSKEKTAVESNKAEPVAEVDRPDIKVYVVGCVNNPGVVTIKKGEIIDDAIKKAGGATKMADLENINLAYRLDENVMLKIKSRAERSNMSNGTNKAEDPPAKAAASSKRGKNKQGSSTLDTTVKQTADPSKANGGVDIVKDSAGALAEESAKTETANKDGRIDINSAGQAELENLPNVGPSTAKAIISYREKNGGFKSIQDIMKITGIKQKTFDKIKDFICIK
jgi:competence protein ComEA